VGVCVYVYVCVCVCVCVCRSVVMVERELRRYSAKLQVYADGSYLLRWMDEDTKDRRKAAHQLRPRPHSPDPSLRSPRSARLGGVQAADESHALVKLEAGVKQAGDEGKEEGAEESASRAQFEEELAAFNEKYGVGRAARPPIIAVRQPSALDPCS